MGFGSQLQARFWAIDSYFMERLVSIFPYVAYVFIVLSLFYHLSLKKTCIMFFISQFQLQFRKKEQEGSRPFRVQIANSLRWSKQKALFIFDLLTFKISEQAQSLSRYYTMSDPHFDMSSSTDSLEIVLWESLSWTYASVSLHTYDPYLMVLRLIFFSRLTIMRKKEVFRSFGLFRLNLFDLDFSIFNNFSISSFSITMPQNCSKGGFQPRKEPFKPSSTVSQIVLERLQLQKKYKSSSEDPNYRSGPRNLSYSGKYGLFRQSRIKHCRFQHLPFSISSATAPTPNYPPNFQSQLNAICRPIPKNLSNQFRDHQPGIFIQDLVQFAFRILFMISNLKQLLKQTHPLLKAHHNFSTGFNAKIDYYKILDISQHAGEEQIKSAFHKKAKQFHPDINPQNEDKFKLINEAYKVLSNENIKRQYVKMHEALKNEGNSMPSSDRQGLAEERDPIKDLWNAHVKYYTAKKKEKMNSHVQRQYGQPYESNQGKSIRNNEQKDPGKKFRMVLWGSSILTVLMLIQMGLKYLKYKQQNKI